MHLLGKSCSLGFLLVRFFMSSYLLVFLSRLVSGVGHNSIVSVPDYFRFIYLLIQYLHLPDSY